MAAKFVHGLFTIYFSLLCINLFAHDYRDDPCAVLLDRNKDWYLAQLPADFEWVGESTNPDGSLVVASANSEKLVVETWNTSRLALGELPTLARTRYVPVPDKLAYVGYHPDLLSPDGKYKAFLEKQGDAVVVVRNASCDTNSTERKIEFKFYDKKRLKLAFSPSGSALLAWNFEGVEIYDLESNIHFRESVLLSHDRVKFAGWLSDDVLIMVLRDGNSRLYNWKNGELVLKYRGKPRRNISSYWGSQVGAAVLGLVQIKKSKYLMTCRNLDPFDYVLLDPINLNEAHTLKLNLPSPYQIVTHEILPNGTLLVEVGPEKKTEKMPDQRLYLNTAAIIQHRSGEISWGP